MTAATPAPPTTGSGEPQGARGIGRATALVSVLNLTSRATGLLRVVAMSAALGATALGDTYQAANLVSNILFELLAGGLLSAALVPTFVDLVDRGRREDAARLGGILLGAALVALTAVVAAALLLADQLMGLLTAGVEDPGLRADQRALGVFLLWFFLPQVLLYACGSVATALLHAERRFVAAAIAPVFNNLVVISAMGAFWLLRDGAPPSLDLDLVEKLVLGAGATVGVLAMTLVPLVALRRTDLTLRPRWDLHDPRLRPLAAQGAWAAGHLGLNQVFAMATVVVAGRVSGGVVAYQVAFTFFLLPYALLANPLTTTLYPRLAAAVAAGRPHEAADDVSWGLRSMSFILLPASVLIGVLARPLLEVVRLGNLDVAGADLVALTTSGYMVGLLGYAASFLLTRAAYAAGDTRSPTLVSLVATGVGAVVLVVGTEVLDGDARLLVLGLTHAGVVTASALGLLPALRRRIGTVRLSATILRDAAFAALAGVAAWGVASSIGIDTRLAAVGSLTLGGLGGALAYVGLHALAHSDELRVLRRPGRVLR
ncbi:murein biosynthesis integral membrane protein MurJ [Actinomarinicola tropica]|uniref:Oligosaccharide flippase family protein n=1 Tax=Actinomarinicola tropica TaxID=2789776 RepID=A0A5Q2RPT4_9ACTN|nr:lipid II flippase MurJ [Actinomarinicola tropica]QGG95225.1 oligosaccharide flippase family protein [Actinomarinicola tropica]